MADGVPKQSVKEILGDFSSLDSAKQLLSELNYDIARDSLSRRDWGKAAKEALVEDPQIIATHGDFRIIYGKFASDRLLITPQRAVINTLLREHPYALFLFSNADQKLWHFVNVKLVADHDDERNKDIKKRRLFRRITVREKEKRLWTAVGRISMLDLALIQPELFGLIPPLTIQSEHDKAFDVEAVTKEFYDAYEGVFKTFWKDLEEQTRDRRWAHDYSLQFLNRLMFLYFVQRKGWLAEDNEFLETFWRTYRKSGEPKDTFFEKWLKVLFFEAFNNQKNLFNTKQREYLPEDIRKALWEAPYLNGGLFKKNKLDEPVFEFQISDSRFGQIFNLFQKYNFTITEDSPLDQEVAVDPEMIGKVYESLVNLTEAGMERSAAGIFYTPRTEIDLMCRLSIVDNLANYIGQQHKNLLYEAVFSLDQEDKEQADKALAKAKLWPDVEKRLNQIAVLDPACGSGSFLVGMLYVLNDLLERAEAQRGEHTSSYERRKQIIGQSLYGVDVMDWACHVAELRLWLALIVDAEFSKEELTIREEPLLPHFSFKVRCGDSLVQEVGGVDMAHRRGVLELSQDMKRRLRELRNEKTKFYSNDPSCKFKTVEALESQEVLVFRELLQDRIKAFDSQAKKLMRVQAEEQAYQQRSLLTGELEGPSKQFTLERERREKQITAFKEEVKSIVIVLSTVRDKATLPFVWDISFAETFSGDSHGFDIVIGNPPYLRQERIADPNLTQEEVTTENKKVYKAKLMRSVYKEYPSFFKYKTATDKATHKIDAKSDLYIYFYFHGLSLLNDKGSFCFITSNSWLDVGYGRDLQEFLLKRCHTKLVIDNKVKRTFKPADINTIIVLFGPPADSKIKDDVALKRTAKFVMFYVPFEEALHPVVFEEIEEFSEKTTRPEYRVFPIKQDELLADGCEIPKEAEGKQSRGPLIKTAKYIGNKWGGRYLRAPDIYWTVLEKYRDKLMRLDKAAEISRGITTGCNEFFFLEPTGKKLEDGSVPVTNDGGWSGTLEENTLCFAVQKVDECDMPVFEPKKFLFCPPDNLPRRAASYIQYGEKMGYNRRATCKARSKWWKLPTDKQNAPLIGFNYNIYDTGRSYISSVSPTYYSDSFHVLRCNNLEVLHGYMHSTFFHFLINVDARTVFGGGKAKLQTFELQDLYCIKEFANIANTKDFAANYKKFCSQEDNYLIDNLSDPLRLSLDEIVFDILGLTQGEREAVYEAVIDLVESRLKKAESLR